MANLTISLKVQRVNVFGPSPSTKWNSTFKWTAAGVGPGNGTWGLKSAGSFGSAPLLKGIFKIWSKAQTATVSGFTNLPRYANKVFSKSVLPVYALTNKTQSDGRGYLLVYADRTTNSENNFRPGYASLVTGAGVTYTSGTTITTTTWG